MTTTTTTISDDTLYDAIVVGVGATGGVAAKQLCEAGLKVLALDAGKAVKSAAEYGSQVTNLARQLNRHFFTKRQQVQKFHGGFWETNPDFFIDDKDNPYTTPEGKPYLWIRGGRLGGRSHTWGGVCLRFSDFEFKAASRDGHGKDWPFGHDDLDPHYAMLERFLGVHGSKDGVAALPDGEYGDPSPMSPGEEALKGAVEKNWDDRKVVISRGIRASRHPEKGEQHTRLSSLGTTLAAAEKTGNFTLRSHVLVSKLLMDASTGKATGVEFVDKDTKALHRARAKVVFLCASTIESIRILMLSTDGPHRDGVGASSGLLGKGLMDHIVSCTYFTMADIPDDGKPTWPLLGSDSIIIPRYQNIGRTNESYLRGFGMWGGIQRMPFPNILRKKKGVALGMLCAMGEALPDDKNFMRLDGDKKDAWGLPVPHIDCAWTENDLAVTQASRAAAEEMAKAAGGEVAVLTELVHTPFITDFMKGMDNLWARTQPGLFVHEVGGARMGTDPKDSVTSPFCQVWDAPNVYVTDGACWVSSGWQNPTLTEMAITARACAHAVEALKKNEL